VDVTSWLLRLTPPRPLVVAGPGGTEVRVAAERAIRERGWRPALNPAEANILLVTGDGLDTYVERVWHSMPAPRVRSAVSTVSDVPRQLDSALAELRDTDEQRANAALPPRHTPEPEPETHSGHEAHERHESHSAHEGHDKHGGHSEQSGHGGHEHHMGGMDLPGGIPMADRAEDRDGLMLDVLHVPLGPVLPLWPAGLIVHTRLQGDVIQQASVEVVGSPDRSFWSEDHRLAARRLDSSTRLLALAGWTDAAAVAQRLRDEALDGAPPAALLRKWARRVRRSRTLRWLLAGIGTTPDDSSTPPSLAGDALARLHSWLDSALAPGQPDGPQETQWIVDNLPTMLAGTELATARLIVASLDPDLDLLTHHDATTHDPNPHHGAHHTDPPTADPHTHHPEPTTSHHGTHRD
jgi:hypothetical protein